jgi:hypothetical protein
VSYLLLSPRQFLICFRWGSCYEHGDEDVRQSLHQFAIQKLLCINGTLEQVESFSDAQIYAVLSQHLALDINTPQYLFNSGSPLDAMKAMHEQIANHMRVCVAVGDGIESLHAVAASEPILSEAASLVMSSTKFSLSRALALVLNGFSVNQGERRELLVAAFFTWARDVAVRLLPRNQIQACHPFSVYALFKALFTNDQFKKMEDTMPSLCPTTETRTFKDVFEKTAMHFNHIIKIQAQKLLARRYLLYFMARGAAALGANNQPGIDAVYPFLYDADDSKEYKLDVKKVSFIIVQVKNDSNASRVKDSHTILRNMDPVHRGLLEESDKVDGRFPIPIIRIVFSLSIPNSSPDFGFCHVKYQSPSQGLSDQSLNHAGQPLLTSYNYTCSGVDENFFQLMAGSSEAWKALVNKSESWSTFYDVSVPDVLRSQLPGCGEHRAHFTSWLGETASST